MELQLPEQKNKKNTVRTKVQSFLSEIDPGRRGGPMVKSAAGVPLVQGSIQPRELVVAVL